MEKLDKKLMTKAEKNSTFSFVHTTITSRQEKKGPEITFPMLSFLYVFIKHGNTGTISKAWREEVIQINSF